MKDDWLDELLKRDEYIADGGFVARVVASLPRRRRRAWLRPLILSVTAAAGLAVALWVLPAETYLAVSFANLLRARSLSAIPLLPVVTIALIFWAAIAAAVSED